MDEAKIDMILNKYPFYIDWKKGKVSKKIFLMNMNGFKEQFLSDEGMTPEEFSYVIEKELKNQPKKWWQVWQQKNEDGDQLAAQRYQ